MQQYFICYDTFYAILNNSESATLQYFIFCKKALDEKYLLKLNNVFNTGINICICMYYTSYYMLTCTE